MRVVTHQRASSAVHKRMTPRRSVRKAQPQASQLHVNVPLTMISVAYMTNPTHFIASRAFPHVPVLHQSNVYYKFQKDDFLRDEAKPRAAATESAGGGFNITTDSYSAQVIAYHKDIADQERANADTVLQLDSVATEFVTQKMLLRKEKQWVTTYFKTGVWATEVAGVASGPSGGQFLRWDVSTSKPKVDILNGRIAILLSTGYDPRTLIIGPYVLVALQNNPQIQDQFKYTSPESITPAMLARYFDLDEVLIAMGVEATNIEGAAITTAFIAGKHALLVYKTKSVGLMMPTAGYVMTWNAYAGSEQGATISKIRMPTLRADRIEGEFAYDMKVVAADCGYFFLDAVS